MNINIAIMLFGFPAAFIAGILLWSIFRIHLLFHRAYVYVDGSQFDRAKLGTAGKDRETVLVPSRAGYPGPFFRAIVHDLAEEPDRNGTLDYLLKLVKDNSLEVLGKGYC